MGHQVVLKSLKSQLDNALPVLGLVQCQMIYRLQTEMEVLTKVLSLYDYVVFGTIPETQGTVPLMQQRDLELLGLGGVQILYMTQYHPRNRTVQT